MPKTETPSYQASRLGLRVAPVYVARALYVKTYGDGGDFPFSRDFATGPINGGGDILEIMGPPSGNTQTVQTELGTSSIGTFSVPLLDRDGEVMRYLGNPATPLAAEVGPDDDVLMANGPIDGYPSKVTVLLDDERIRCVPDVSSGRFIWCQRGVDGTSRARHLAGTRIHNGEQLRAGQRMQLYAGYDDVPFVNFLRLAKMEIVSIDLAADATTFVISLADIQRSLRKAVFTLATSEDPVLLTGHWITIALRMLLSSGTAVDIGGTCQVLAGNLVKGTSDFTLFQPGDYVFIGIGTDTEQLARVQQVVDATTFISGLALTPTDPGQFFRKAGQNGQYDVLRRSNALAMPLAMVDVAGLEALRDESPDDQFHFRLSSAEADGKAFLESDIWRPNNCFPFITQEGKYSAKRYKAPPAAATKTLTEDDIVTWAWAGGEREIINEVDFLYDWNTTVAPQDYAKKQRYTAAAETGSVNAFGLKPPLKMSARGVRSDLGAQAMLDARAFQLLQRYSVPPPVLRVTVLYTNHILDIGDTVAVTHSLIPNRATGKRGLVNQIFEVRDVSPVFGPTGKVGLTLLHTGVQEIIPTPATDGEQNALLDLLVFRAAFFNSASVSLVATEETETGSVTVTTQRSGDTLHITARQYLSSVTANAPIDVFSRIRVGSVGGTLIDGIMPEAFLSLTVTKTTTVDQYARRGIIKHDVLYSPPEAGPVTIVMSGLCNSSGAAVRDRSLTVTVRSR